MSLIELNQREKEAVRHIRQHLASTGKMPSCRELMQALGYKSPRSASVMFEKLIAKEVLIRQENRKLIFAEGLLTAQTENQTVDIPYVGVTSCSGPLFAEENIEAYYKISQQLVPGQAQYFFLRIVGDSMNLENINDGDLVLIRQQDTAKKNDLVLALIDDEATIKKYIPEDGFIILKPCSSNQEHKPIILTEDFTIQGIVVRSFSNL